MVGDVIRELLEMAQAAKTEAQISGSAYEKGRHFALYEVISLVAQQADAFGIDRSDLGLAGVDPERDLLGTGPIVDDEKRR